MSPSLADFSLLELFSMELQANHQAMENGLVGLEADPRPERVEPLMRAAHSIKGAARIVELPQAVALAHAMEEVLLAAQKGALTLTTAHVDALLAASDLFGRLAGLAPADMPTALAAEAPQAERMGQTLHALLSTHPPTAEAAQGVALANPSGLDGQSAALASTPGLDHLAAPSPQALPSGSGQPPPLLAPPETQDGVVRLSAEVLGRLMGLAGQCLVEASVLPPLLKDLRSQRRDLLDLSGVLSNLRAFLPEGAHQADLERAMALVKSLTIAHSRAVDPLDALSRRLDIFSSRLYRQVLASRMRPFEESASHFPRLVRDLARELGKEAVLTLEGLATPVDRDILDRLEAPFIHLLRNAVDHGLESPAKRAAAGKPPQGRVTLAARHLAGMLEVRVEDDGAGIDLAHLRTVIANRGLATADMIARMVPAELYDFLFLPGFSTAGQVSQVSGRGVGLDVVKTMIQEMGGQLLVESRPSLGSAFILRLPLTLSVVRALVVLVAGEPYAIPLSRIYRVLEIPLAELPSLEGRQYITLDCGSHVGLVQAAQLLNLPGRDIPDNVSLVVLGNAETRHALAVEAFLGERDLVVKPLDQRLGKVPNVCAAALLEDGSPVLILDVDDVLRSVESLLTTGRVIRVGATNGREQSSGPKRVLVVDDSLTVREVERQLLANRGYHVVTAVDGMEGLAIARSGEFDLIITDVDMPRLTGLELTRAVKADPTLSTIPVMIVSYKDRDADRLAGLTAGADYYLAKSGFRDDALLTAVADLIGEP